MDDEKLYKQMYLHLFNEVTNVLDYMTDDPEEAKRMLMLAQEDCESIYINGEEERSPIINFPKRIKKS